MKNSIKRKLENSNNDTEFNLSKKFLQASHTQTAEKRLIVILHGAQMETVKVGSTFELLNCDDHTSILKKNKREPGSCRPDITHQCLLMLMDSPLNRAGLLQVFIITERNVLIEINPQTRIPRTFKRFAGLMVQLLHKFSIKAGESSVKLMKVIKNPVTNYLPVGCKKIALSFSGKMVSTCRDLVPKEDEPIAIIVGAFAHGVVKNEFAEELVSISQYPLSGAIACSKLCSAFEEVWNIV